MIKINENYLKLPGSYLFSEIAKKVAKFTAENPDKKVIKLGIGDVTRPLTPSSISAMHKAVDEMSMEETFRGYGPEQGYDFLRSEIAIHDYAKRGIKIDVDEIFISDGSKSDTGNIGDILDINNRVAICDPVYPVYIDTNAMSGRAGEYQANGRWSKLIYMPCLPENNFVPQIPDEKADIIYLCFPNNPTGAAITKIELQKWVDYALANNSIIMYDAAYEAYITEDLPHSIYEIDRAKECAIEFRSFSKNAGFTGTRCAYTIVPKELTVNVEGKGKITLNSLWNRRQTTKFNGVPYIIQRAAAAIYTKQGQKEVKDLVSYYIDNARIIREGLTKAGFKISGGINAPYIWLKTIDGLSSWEFFDLMLSKVNVVGTPGVGFGPSGEGYFRLTSFGSKEKTIEAVQRIIQGFC